jgi:predicted metal-dependent hydrolase
MTSPKTDATQRELFAPDAFEARQPAAPKASPEAPLPSAAPPLFKPPTVPTRTLPAPPRGPNDGPLKQIQLGSHTVHYLLRRSARRSHGFMINDDGLHVTSPRNASQNDIDSAIRAKGRWILTKLFERSERQVMRAARPTVEWADGARLPYLGGDVTLRLQDAARSHCVYDPETRELRVGVPAGLSEWQIRERVKLWFQDEAGTRWGSCTVEGNIRLNWKLVHYPLALLDYVVVHELAHLREMNHSARFWAVVGETFPDYEGAKAALKKRSVEMPVLFPDA